MSHELSRPAARSRGPILWIALGAAIALLIGVGATAVVVLTGDEQAVAGEPVLLEPAAETGPEPFVAIAGSAVPAFPDEVRRAAAAAVAGLDADPATGTRTVAGTTDVLYGGSGELGTCDPDTLTGFLTANPAAGSAWAAVPGIAPEGIDDYVAGLTPVVLLHDTAVTNHGFGNGIATPRQSVLQAGTAVLVDASGIPVVRCACGNPLTAPTVRDLPAADFRGARWDGFDASAALTVTAGPRTKTFTLVDIDTGARYQRPAGLAAESAPALLAATPTGIQRSTDAQQWTTVATVDQGSLASLEASEDLVVAVGGVAWDGSGRQPSGVITTSPDGTTWSRPLTTPDHLVDVAFGNGVWLALGGPSPGSAGGAAPTVPIYRSTDGANWDRQQVTLPGDPQAFDLAGSIDFGAGAWFLPAFDNVGDAGIPLLYRSTDGTTWTDVSAGVDAGGISTASAHNGQSWGVAGVKLHYDSGLEQAPRQELLVGGSVDGAEWAPVPGVPSNLRLTRLSCTGDRGWLGTAVDTTGADWVGVIHTSADLLTWSPLGTSPADGVTDVIAVGAGTGPDASRCGIPVASPGPAAPAEPADRAPDGGPPAEEGRRAGDLGLTRPISTPACDGTGIVILHSAVDPAAYASEMQSFLDRFPDAQYLRTDLTGCSSLNRASQQGTLIYAAYIPVGLDQAAVCAAQRQFGGAYAKWLDNTSDPNGRIACG